MMICCNVPFEVTGYDIEEVDDMVLFLEYQSRSLIDVARVDHHRLALACNEMMPPACLVIKSDPLTNTRLIAENPRVGLDLPFRFLAYFEHRAPNPSLAFCTSDYLRVRHGITNTAALDGYQESVDRLVTDVAETDRRVLVDGTSVHFNYGIVELRSRYDFETTEYRIRNSVLGGSNNGGTIGGPCMVWFNEIDFQSQAREHNVWIRKCKLLLFDGPKQGGKAMKKFTRMGLIEFCQKVLILEDKNGRTKVLFNDIEKMVALHYDEGTVDLISKLTHRVINYRMKRILCDALS